MLDCTTIDRFWYNLTSGEERIEQLSQEDRLQLACIWVEARETNSWESFANHHPGMERKHDYLDKAHETVIEKSWERGFAISKGDRGEFLGLLLLTLARDSNVGRADGFGRPSSGKRWFCLKDFLYGQLFRTQTSTTPFVTSNSLQALRKIQIDFQNSQLHFNHFVKVHELKAIDLTSLLLLQGRGAAVLCANKQSSIDSINVFLKSGTKLVRTNVGLVFAHYMNDENYTWQPQQKVLDAMDPYDIGVLAKGDPAAPLIKIVFALAAKKPALNVVRRAPTKEYNAVVYEIWCAGISSDILGPIDHKDVGIWEALLQASYGWKGLYKTDSKVITKLRRSTMPGAARDNGHYSGWASRTTNEAEEQVIPLPGSSGLQPPSLGNHDNTVKKKKKRTKKKRT